MCSSASMSMEPRPTTYHPAKTKRGPHTAHLCRRILSRRRRLHRVKIVTSAAKLYTLGLILAGEALLLAHFDINISKPLACVV